MSLPESKKDVPNKEETQSSSIPSTTPAAAASVVAPIPKGWKRASQTYGQAHPDTREILTRYLEKTFSLSSQQTDYNFRKTIIAGQEPSQPELQTYGMSKVKRIKSAYDGMLAALATPELKEEFRKAISISPIAESDKAPLDIGDHAYNTSLAEIEAFGKTHGIKLKDAEALANVKKHKTLVTVLETKAEEKTGTHRYMILIDQPCNRFSHLTHKQKQEYFEAYFSTLKNGSSEHYAFLNYFQKIVANEGGKFTSDDIALAKNFSLARTTKPPAWFKNMKPWEKANLVKIMNVIFDTKNSDPDPAIATPATMRGKRPGANNLWLSQCLVVETNKQGDVTKSSITPAVLRSSAVAVVKKSKIFGLVTSPLPSFDNSLTAQNIAQEITLCERAQLSAHGFPWETSEPRQKTVVCHSLLKAVGGGDTGLNAGKEDGIAKLRKDMPQYKYIGINHNITCFVTTGKNADPADKRSSTTTDRPRKRTAGAGMGWVLMKGGMDQSSDTSRDSEIKAMVESFVQKVVIHASVDNFVKNIHLDYDLPQDDDFIKKLAFTTACNKIKEIIQQAVLKNKATDSLTIMEIQSYLKLNTGKELNKVQAANILLNIERNRVLVELYKDASKGILNIASIPLTIQVLGFTLDQQKSLGQILVLLNRFANINAEVPADLNTNLEKSAIEGLLTRYTGNIFMSGCKSGKDREAVMQLYMAALTDFYEEYGKLPNHKDPADREKFVDKFAQLFITHHHAFLSETNSDGCQGLKSLRNILPNDIIVRINELSPGLIKLHKHSAHLNDLHPLKIEKLPKYKAGDSDSESSDSPSDDEKDYQHTEHDTKAMLKTLAKATGTSTDVLLKHASLPDNSDEEEDKTDEPTPPSSSATSDSVSGAQQNQPMSTSSSSNSNQSTTSKEDEAFFVPATHDRHVGHGRN